MQAAAHPPNADHSLLDRAVAVQEGVVCGGGPQTFVLLGKVIYSKVLEGG